LFYTNKVGANATILPKIKIGKYVVIGAGAVVAQDVSDNFVLIGNPARPINRKVVLLAQ
jgi:acetyltransferase-like isoleucine patch superfamily enzyme